jgi:hypothetical protein
MGMSWLDETHMRVGAICNRATWMEYQIEMAIMELTDADDMDETQGAFGAELIGRLKKVLSSGACHHDVVEDQIRALLSDVSRTFKLRDHVVHCTWIQPNGTTPDSVVGQRWWRQREERREFSMAELDKIAADLDAFASQLSSLSWNAVHPRDNWLPL